ncbi:SpoIID/LytB domain-containing protein [Niallia sp. Krafla_26]|uniref:SpoIID/LytB domain-containing protein n=1 Tax=Niallia sp. Krafla_26 TaxID=3064703 RepID=UPI003D17674F
MKKALLLFMVFTIFISLLPMGQGHAQTTEPIVKVKLINFLGNKTEIVLKPTGDYVTNDENVVLKANETYTLKQVNGKLLLFKGGNLLDSYESFSVQPIDPRKTLSINNRLYLGSFDFVVENNLYVRPINSVYMEDYLKGVVPIEMYPSWNVEALKTQAVAARTYAMSYLNRGIINDTISYQVYGGCIWTPNTTKAVDETAGQVLQYNGRLIDAVYSASNGGMTESNANAWGNVAVPYLTIKPDPYDPKTVWSFSFNKTQIDLTTKDLAKPSEWWTTTKEADPTIASNIKLWLNNNGYANKDIKITSIPTFSLFDIGSGGRMNKGNITVDFLVKDIVDATGKLIPQRISFSNVSASKIRAIMGNRTMLSYMIDEVNTDTNIVRVKGRGDGHGVGMSQWGAKYMADAGKSYEEILTFYYTGISIVKSYEPSAKMESPLTMSPIKYPIIKQEETPTEEVKPIEVAKDQTAPIIKDLASSYNNSTKTVSFTYSFNEDSIVTVYVKDSKGTIIKHLENQTKKSAGKYTLTWDVASVGNGNYTFGIVTTDLFGNTSSAAHSFSLNKPVVVTDKTAPSIKDVATSYNNSTKKVSLSYSINEPAYVSVYVKNSKGAIVQNLEKQVKKEKGKVTMTWNKSAVSNGAYTLVITAKDLAGNTSVSSPTFNLAKVQTGKINASNVMIRQKATTSSKSLGKLQKNQNVTVISKSGSWTYIQYGKIKGYVSSKYISHIR